MSVICCQVLSYFQLHPVLLVRPQHASSSVHLSHNLSSSSQLSYLFLHWRWAHYQRVFIILRWCSNMMNVTASSLTYYSSINWIITSFVVINMIVFTDYQGWAGMTFGHLGTATGMAQPIPKLWEQEREWKILFPTFGNGNENSTPNFWERKRE